ncbi:MAG: ROK family protein [Bifidobacteriaceae bacterium]|jgi:predicted NBD/HSP70 family sugar kinase|nr:ROK family protein [Bifidobacteriaceae bacterium]
MPTGHPPAAPAARAGTRQLAATPASASQSSLRSHNLHLVYQLIAQSEQPLSRAQVAERVGMTRATSSSLVDRLIAGGLLEELDSRVSGRAGRPATPVRPARGTLAGLGLEINVDYVGARAVDLAGQVLAERVEPASLAGLPPDEACRALAAAARAVRRRLAARRIPLVGAVVAVAGPVDRATGRLRSAPNLGWRDVDLPALVGARLRLAPIGADNEASLAARAELAAAADPAASFVYVSGGIGIGAGLVREGALYGGAHGWAGELGHVTVDVSGPPCACGASGCLEQYAGRRAILARAAPKPAAPDDRRDPASRAGPEDIARLARQGDPSTLAALDEAGRAIGLALAGAINFTDIGTVVLGGDFTQLAPFLKPRLVAELERRVVSWGWSPTDQLVRPALGPTLPALTGAALAATDRVAADPEAFCTP